MISSKNKSIKTKKDIETIKIQVSKALLTFLIFALVTFAYTQWKNWNQIGSIKRIEYMEDIDNTLEFGEIKEERFNKASGNYTWSLASGLMKGNNTSTWWVRIKTDDLLKYKEKISEKRSYNDSMFLSITNPTVEKVVLYIPTISNAEENYKTYIAGWGYPNQEHQDQDFSYPVFRLPDRIPKEKYVYIQLSSSYTNNYSFRVMNESIYNSLRQDYAAINALFFGLVIAFGINNFIQFTSLRISAHLYYVIYLSTILLYQGSVMGGLRLFLGDMAELLIANVASLGLLMMIAALYFFRSYLETKKTFPKHDKFSVFLTILCIADIMVMVVGYKYLGNIASVIIANIVGIFIISTTYQAIQRNISYAKYLFIGWLFTLSVSVIFNLRAWGFIPNNEFTLFLILIPIVAEAVLLSLGLAELVKKLGADKENVLKLYNISQEQVVSKETAFLQAQIKPHFLFNALNVIEALCYIDSKKAGELILDLSKFLQHSFDFRNLQRYIPFEEELEFVKAYVKIEQARFRNELKVEYFIENVKELMLPPLIIQPLVENAIKHGIRKQGTSGTVLLRVKNLSDCYRIEVEDDGSGMTKEQIEEALKEDKTQSGGVGISNIQKRLKMFYSTELKFESEIGEGTKVTIMLPKDRE